MAEIQELENEVSELESIETKDAQTAPEVNQEPPKPAQDDIPEEFRGMSLKDLANIAKHARREMGKQANELGEVRKLADELLKSTLKPKEPEPPKEIDFFENPQEAIRQAVENNPKVLAAEQLALQSQRQYAVQQLAQKHPDYVNVVRDADFQKWVQGSKVRMTLLQAADRYDLDAADELLSTFKELKAVKAQQVSDAEKTARTKAMTAAAVDTGGSGESGKKIYRRADLIRLRMRDPSKYDAMQDEIMAAYQEGRVK